MQTFTDIGYFQPHSLRITQATRADFLLAGKKAQSDESSEGILMGDNTGSERVILCRSGSMVFESQNKLVFLV
jgi:hypothetical protein